MTETGNQTRILSIVNMVRSMILRRAIPEFKPELFSILSNDAEKGMSSSKRNLEDEKGLQKLTNQNKY